MTNNIEYVTCANWSEKEMICSFAREIQGGIVVTGELFNGVDYIGSERVKSKIEPPAYFEQYISKPYCFGVQLDKLWLVCRSSLQDISKAEARFKMSGEIKKRYGYTEKDLKRLEVLENL